MKKAISIIGSVIILGGFLIYSLQSTGKLTSSEECNAVVLAEEQLTGDTVNCCVGKNCTGPHCGYFILDGSSSKIDAYWEW